MELDISKVGGIPHGLEPGFPDKMHRLGRCEADGYSGKDSFAIDSTSCSNLGSNGTSRKWDVLYTALGDSLASGMGPIILGYPYHYRDWLKSPDGPYPGKRVKMANLARYGWSSNELLKALTSNSRYRDAVKAAHVMTLDVGGNDLLYRRKSEKELENALESFKNNLERILGEIRELNDKAQIYLMDIYNPFSEWCPGYARPGQTAVDSGSEGLKLSDQTPDGQNITDQDLRNGVSEGQNQTGQISDRQNTRSRSSRESEIRLQASTYVPRLNQIIHLVGKDPSLNVSGIACVYERFTGYENKLTLMSTVFRDIHPNHMGQKVIASCFICVSKVYQMTKGQRLS